MPASHTVPPRTPRLVRPEQLHLSATGQGLAGTVRAVRFLGACYELEVALPKSLVRLRTSSEYLAPGAAVWVTLSGSGWHVSRTRESNR